MNFFTFYIICFKIILCAQSVKESEKNPQNIRFLHESVDIDVYDIHVDQFYVKSLESFAICMGRTFLSSNSFGIFICTYKEKNTTCRNIYTLLVTFEESLEKYIELFHKFCFKYNTIQKYLNKNQLTLDIFINFIFSFIIEKLDEDNKKKFPFMIFTEIKYCNNCNRYYIHKNPENLNQNFILNKITRAQPLDFNFYLNTLEQEILATSCCNIQEIGVSNYFYRMPALSDNFLLKIIWDETTRSQYKNLWYFIKDFEVNLPIICAKMFELKAIIFCENTKAIRKGIFKGVFIRNHGCLVFDGNTFRSTSKNLYRYAENEQNLPLYLLYERFTKYEY